MLFRHREETEINLHDENIRCLEIKKELVSKGGSKVKVCNHNGRYSIEVQVQSLFQDQHASWVRNVNGNDKFVREVISIQEEKKASDKSTAQEM